MACRFCLAPVAAVRTGAHIVVVTANPRKASIPWCGKIFFGGAEVTIVELLNWFSAWQFNPITFIGSN